jgi:signal transduction histidine kinase/HAMP domain-containing protein
MSLYTRIFLIVSLLLILTTGALSYALIRGSSSDIVASSRRDLEASAQLLAYASAFAGEVSRQIEGQVSDHMLAEARLVAHLVSVAEQGAGLSPGQINALLRDVSERTVVDELWITDETGHGYLTSTGRDFTFSPNPLQQPQMHEFWPLLQNPDQIIVQQAQPRELNTGVYKYVGVGGIDQPRIVQVGYEASSLQAFARNVVVQELVDRLTGQGDIAFIRVVNPDNTTLVSSSEPRPGYARDPSDSDWQLISEVRRETQPRSALDGDVLIAAAPYRTPGNDTPSVVLIYQTTERIEASTEAAVVRGLGLTALALVIGVMASMALAQSVARPVRHLGEAAQALAQGHWEQDIQPSSVREIDALAQAFRSMAGQLRASYAELEGKVQARTAELAQRIDQLALINRVGRDAISVLDLRALLPQLTGIIQAGFNYYAVLILLVDEEKNEVRLNAATTTETVDLLERGLTLPVGMGVIGHVAESGEALVLNDVQHDARYLMDARLPGVRAELALPLKIGRRVLGVMDLESTVPGSFDREKVQVLQTLADQIAIAIQNARLYQAAQVARADAETANRAKSSFLAAMSHELRTPLNSIINFTGFVTDEVFGPVTEEQRDFLTRSLRSAEHLLGLINDILDLSKIEAGKMELHREQIELGDIIKGVLDTAHGLSQHKPLTLHLEVPAVLPTVWADRTRVRQVLLNLLSNAIKFTEQGRVTLAASADEDWVTLSVSDTGIGIAPEELRKVFAEFEQVDDALARRAGGTGLGMPISKRFVEMHGGRMWVESEPGRGSTFSFTLPRRAALVEQATLGADAPQPDLATEIGD